MTASMPHRYGLRTVLFATSLVVLAAACEKDQLKGPDAEVKKNDIKLNLPAVPDFALPPTNADGSHSVKEMRVKGRKFIDTEVTVKGVVTWAYDCPTAKRQPGMDEKEVLKMINEDPSLCDRPKFYLGDTADTPAEKSMWVVDVPRPYYKIELDRLPKEETRNPPPDKCDAKKDTCPKYAVGDVIVVTGTWKTSSPHSERNSDGLLVYKKMKNETQGWESPIPDPTKDSTTPAGRPSPEDLVRNKRG